jgi:protein phosphatase methylesterase 1
MLKFPNKNFVLIGHSLGGSVCARVTDALTNKQKLDRIVGMIIIDVVEGTALETLSFMNQIINDRPTYFESL